MVKKPPVFRKLDQEYVRKLGVTKLPTLDYSWRRGASTNDIPSLNSDKAGEPALVTSIMDPTILARESAETQAAILDKSKRIAPAYNKGAAQYISDETDPKTIGRK